MVATEGMTRLGLRTSAWLHVTLQCEATNDRPTHSCCSTAVWYRGASFRVYVALLLVLSLYRWSYARGDAHMREYAPQRARAAPCDDDD